MLVWDIVLALIVAVIFSLLLVAAAGRRGPGPWAGFLFFFLVLFLAVWAAGVWLRPIGPVVYGGYWVGALVVGVLIALLLAAAVPPGPRVTPVEVETPPEGAPAETPEEEAVTTALGVFFWILLLGLIAAIVLGYVIE
jgi:hypothetical protein